MSSGELRRRKGLGEVETSSLKSEEEKASGLLNGRNAFLVFLLAQFCAVYMVIRDELSFGFLYDRDFHKIAMILSMHHWYYFLVWTRAKSFQSICNAFGFVDYVRAFAMGAHLIKVFQLVAIVIWYCTLPWLMEASPIDYWSAFVKKAENISLVRWCLGIELVLLGQILNVAVYQTLGEAGVYYGCRLGKTIPWVHGLPFSVVPHPQYLGATLSEIGGCILLATPFHIERGIYGIGMLVMVLYGFSSAVEQYL